MQTTLNRPLLRNKVGLSWLILIVLLCAGCAQQQGSSLANIDDSLQADADVYALAQKQLDGGNYLGAITTLEMLLEESPFGRYAEQSKLDLMYAKLLVKSHSEAQSLSSSFIEVSPQHPNVDYAYFINALSTYTLDLGFLNNTFGLDMAKRDMGNVNLSFEKFGEFLQKYPQSPYAPAARRRMLKLREILARHEIVVAEYYLHRRAFLAALNRASWALERIPGSSYSPWALAVQTLAYKHMGFSDRSKEALDLLNTEFPGHLAIENAISDYREFTLPDNEISISDLLTFGIFRPPSEERVRISDEYVKPGDPNP